MLAFIVLALLHLCTEANGQETAISEYKIKAAFLFNFARYVEWPGESFASPESPVIIGVFGDNPFGTDLEETVRNKTINNHPVEVKQVQTPAECAKCHVLFISKQQKKHLPEILAATQGVSVLTVGEFDRFTEEGGMINFVPEGRKFRFQIRDDVAKKASLKISSKLLALSIPAGH